MNTQDRIDKLAGVAYGTAVGDALGYPVEFASPGQGQCPRVEGYQLVSHGGRKCALYSDDTQMFLAVARGLLTMAGQLLDSDAVGEAVAAELVKWSHSSENTRALGSACMAGCRALESGVPWRRAGNSDAGGCGAAMRSMAYGMVCPEDPRQAAEVAAEHAWMTHGHPWAQASAAAVAGGVAALLDGHSPGDAVEMMSLYAVEYDRGTAQMITEARWLAEHAGTHEEASPARVLDRWRGWTGHEAVAASVYCFFRSSGSYRSAVLTAVNSPGDSDSLGAITGALSGAHLGVEAIPENWILDLENSPQFAELVNAWILAFSSDR